MAFSEFPEQEQVVQLLQRSLDQARLAHAYLFAGPGLSELEAVARTLAKTLNCLNPPRMGKSGLALDSCDNCLNCRKIEAEGHADVQWLRPESKSRIITIDQIRELMQTVHLKPSEARYKVAVIVAADRLNTQAANAFLKTLEEPPVRSILILLTTEPQRVLETILSRCLRLTFAGEGGLRFQQAHLPWLAPFAELAAQEKKSILTRYKLLGVLMTRLAAVKGDAEKAASARSPLDRYDDIDPRLREKWEDELAAAQEAEYRRQRAESLLALQWWLRDIWLQSLTLGPGGDLLSFPSLAGAGNVIANRITADQATDNLDVLEKTQRLLASNVQEALALEVGLLKLQL